MRTLRILVASVVLALAGGASGQTLTTLHSFTGGADGWQSFAGLVQGSDGYLYGTAHHGGTYNKGTVFQISSAGTLTTLHHFNGTDGSSPSIGGVLVEGSDGYFYGMTYKGGTYNTGTVFKISSAGTFTTLYSFTGGADGSGPEANLVQGNDGYFYGTTFYGGTNNLGTVFKISPAGALTTLYQFSGTDGKNPYTGLVQGNDGYFYGTTFWGGTNHWGTVFRINSAGTLTTLHHFGGSTDGADPWGTLVQGNDGCFYGTTSAFGPAVRGTVFKISSAGTFTTLHGFTDGADGGGTQGALVYGSDGYFYGTTYYGGTTNSSFPNGAGVVFRISSAGALTTLYQFSGADGSESSAGLVQGSDGSFYGTTPLGGTYNRGTIFQLSVPLSPPANQISAIQVADTDVVITIPSVAGETYQLQYRDSLTDGDWSNVVGASTTNSIGGPLTLTDPDGASQSQRFYRVVITP